MAKLPNSAQSSLFHILPAAPASGPVLKGIARRAASSSPAAQGHQVEFRALKVASILNKSVSKRRLSFARSINPYRGCEFACRYCYARYTHEYMELRHPDDFERKIFIKQDAAWLLQQELRTLPAGEEIAIGTATDPYQPIERRALVTRGLLQVLAGRRGLRIGIVTKSALIRRDIDLLQQIAAHNELVIHLTITTADARLARILEPRAPRPDLRLKTVAALRQAGLRTGVLCSPLLPGITDNLNALNIMAGKAKAADASFFAAQPLFLKSCSRDTYLNFVREHFPKLEPLYKLRYDRRDFVAEDYRKRMEALVSAVTRKHNLAERSTDALLTRDAGPRPPMTTAQTTLWQIRKPAQRETGQPPSIASMGRLC